LSCSQSRTGWPPKTGSSARSGRRYRDRLAQALLILIGLWVTGIPAALLFGLLPSCWP
jgi:hypothetical protein